MSRRKLGGYVDNEALQRARRATEDAINVTKRLHIKAESTGGGYLYRYIAGLAQAHSQILEAILTMQEIRSERIE